jgi:hypothetical protein
MRAVPAEHVHLERTQSVTSISDGPLFRMREGGVETRATCGSDGHDCQRHLPTRSMEERPSGVVRLSPQPPLAHVQILDTQNTAKAGKSQGCFGVACSWF